MIPIHNCYYIQLAVENQWLTYDYPDICDCMGTWDLDYAKQYLTNLRKKYPRQTFRLVKANVPPVTYEQIEI